MSKTVLTLDEINLLKHSEEPKNIELYGNLYNVINNLKNPKAISLENLPDLNDLGKSAITINKKTLMNNVIKEWYAERVSEEDPNKKVHCGLCNTPNKYLYYIRNRKNNTLLNVGSHCILKFPGLEGYIEKKQQLNEIIKGHQIVTRRNEFYAHFPNVENIISVADKYFSSLPILLPYNLYTNLEDTITKLRLIYTKYVQEGKKSFVSNLSSFELFQIELQQYKSYKDEAEIFIKRNINNPSICRRSEIDWLITNKKYELLKQISKNNGLYTQSTLKNITSLNFIKKYAKNIFDRNISDTLCFMQFAEASIYVQLKKFGYNPNVTFRMSLNKFMEDIGAECILNMKKKYNLEDYIHDLSILSIQSNIDSILNYISDFTTRTPYVFLYDNVRGNIFLYRKIDKAIRTFKAEHFIAAYSTHILNTDNILKKYILDIAYNKEAQWTSIEDQGKLGIDGVIRKLYKQHKDKQF